MLAFAPDTIVHQRYQVVRLVGRGGMGAVYEAIDLRLRSSVALKHMMVEGEYLSRAFEHEAQLLANMRHPALPRVIDHFTETQGQFLVMEYFSGDDLAALVKRRGSPFPVDQVLQWADQILDVLQYLHSRQPPVIHRDIKPQNLKLLESGEIILLDFGLAKGAVAQSTRFTTGGSIVGYTPQFAPLEQIEGTGTGPGSDLYSLAATLHHLLTNAYPVDALARASAAIRHQPDPLQPAHVLNPQVPPAVSAVLQQALALDDALRPSSAGVMRSDLRRAQQTGVFVSSDATVVDPPTAAATVVDPPISADVVTPTQSRGSRVWLLLGGLLLLLLLGGGGAWALTRSNSNSAAGRTPAPTGTTIVEAVVPVVSDPPTPTSTTAPTSTNVIPTEEPTPEPTETPQPTPTETPQPTPTMPALSVRPANVNASSFAPQGVDGCGTANTYDPAKAIDGQTDTAWRVQGSGGGEWIELSFREPMQVAEVGIVAGFDKIDPCDGTDRFFQGRIVRKARLEFDGGERVEVALLAVRSIQYVTIPDILTQRLRIVILETSQLPENGRDLAAISEIDVQARPLR